MTRSELLKKIIEKYKKDDENNSGSSNQNFDEATVEKIFDTVIEQISHALEQHDRVELRGFGSFSTRTYEPRKARNPRNNTVIDLGKHSMPHFKVSKALRKMLNEDENVAG